jgi:hypothetical protein
MLRFEPIWLFRPRAAHDNSTRHGQLSHPKPADSNTDKMKSQRQTSEKHQTHNMSYL